MTLIQQILTVGVAVLAIVLTRFLPFLLFRPGKPTPPYILFLGKFLPSAIFSLLVVYCLRNLSFATGGHGMAQLFSSLVTLWLQIRYRNLMGSIAGGTFCYMLLIRI